MRNEMTQGKRAGRGPAAAGVQDGAYFPPSTILRKLIQENIKDGTVTLPSGVFELLLRDAIMANGFDKDWYRSAYADVTQALANGVVKDELLHFVQSGYREGRLPRVFEVDDVWYRNRYPDIDEEIEAGRIATSQQHYLTAGYFEGRFPNAATEEMAAPWIRMIYRSK